MPRIQRLGYKEIANARIASRMRQVGVLILTIIVGVLISVSVNS